MKPHNSILTNALLYYTIQYSAVTTLYIHYATLLYNMDMFSHIIIPTNTKQFIYNDDDDIIVRVLLKQYKSKTIH